MVTQIWKNSRKEGVEVRSVRVLWLTLHFKTCTKRNSFYLCLSPAFFSRTRRFHTYIALFQYHFNITCDRPFTIFGGSFPFSHILTVFFLYCVVSISHLSVFFLHLVVPLLFFSYLTVSSSHYAVPTSHVTVIFSHLEVPLLFSHIWWFHCHIK